MHSLLHVRSNFIAPDVAFCGINSKTLKLQDFKFRAW